MSKFGYPIVFDATHSVQQPGGMREKWWPKRIRASFGKSSSSRWCWRDFMETHEDPDNAPSDGPNMIH